LSSFEGPGRAWWLFFPNLTGVEHNTMKSLITYPVLF
jgi:hypothetical protein